MSDERARKAAELVHLIGECLGVDNVPRENWDAAIAVASRYEDKEENERRSTTHS